MPFTHHIEHDRAQLLREFQALGVVVYDGVDLERFRAFVAQVRALVDGLVPDAPPGHSTRQE